MMKSSPGSRETIKAVGARDKSARIGLWCQYSYMLIGFIGGVKK